jgi:hypothetical protein
MTFNMEKSDSRLALNQNIQHSNDPFDYHVSKGVRK